MLLVLGIVYYEYKQHTAWQTQKTDVPVITINTAGEKSKPGETQVVYIKGDNTVTREIVYVPKEIDAQTGKLEKTDVQVETAKPKVFVKVNSKDFEVPVNVKEDSKFEKGKLLITEQTEMRMNLTAPKPQFNLGLGWCKEGPAIQVNGPLYKNVSWWVYGDRKTVAGGVQFPIMN